MVSFENDYNTGMHPKLLEALTRTNLEPLTGYGEDKYTLLAKERIIKACGNANLDVYLMCGGTQTNSIIIDSLLKDYEGVISPRTGHIANHEAGAIEHLGHKVLTLPDHDGKLSSLDIDKYCSSFYKDANSEHEVFPGVVYLSFPTEQGSLYTKQELKDIYTVCKKYNLRLFIDGARLTYGLAGEENDVTLNDITNYSDAFYIGGTKCGAIAGEAVVFKKEITPPHFVNFIKKRGALLAKGRLYGVQFATLFENNLYFEIGKYAIEKAKKLKDILKSKGYKLYYDSPTNQQFILMENTKFKELQKHIGCSFWENKDDNHTVVRFVTCWSTTDEDLKELERLL